jgi:hypothetical protein
MAENLLAKLEQIEARDPVEAAPEPAPLAAAPEAASAAS